MLASEYNPISRLAIAAAISAAIGTAAIAFSPLIVFAIVAIPVGMFALRATRKYQLGGHSLALAATAIACVSVLLTPAWHIYQYRTETLPGHRRLSLDISNPAALDSLNGRPVCLKGYSLYYGGDTEVDSFLLSPDGDHRNAETAITVVTPLDWQHQYDPIAVSGVLHVDPSFTDPVKRYTLSAVKISTAKTSSKLAPRTSNGC